MPKHSLDEVKALVNEALKGDRTKVWFSGKSRSIDYVIHVYQCSEGEAEHIVLQGMLKLEPVDFAKTVIMNPAPDLVVADEYGLKEYEGHNWYVKLVIEDEEGNRLLTSISFHPAERPLNLATGEKLPMTLEASKHYKPKKK
ncbi:MAG: hypothetical protein EOP04_25655 [Proteobacteria bacterium]|nr:MAG: hypothetical protein EOP04_25655 [Pseudomonadota bacterium]